jgi:hypothetical protein
MICNHDIAEQETACVERLRQGVDPDDIQETEAAMDKGADEIERLREQSQAAAKAFADERAENERLRAALQTFIEAIDAGHAPPLEAYDAARAAMAGQ